MWWVGLHFYPGAELIPELSGPPWSWLKSYKSRQSSGIMTVGTESMRVAFLLPTSCWLCSTAGPALLLPIHLCQLCIPTNGPIPIKLQLPNCWCCISIRFPLMTVIREIVLMNNNYIVVQDEELLGNHSSIQLAWSDLRLEIIGHVWMQG